MESFQQFWVDQGKFIDRLEINLIGSKADGLICLITEDIWSNPELFFGFNVWRAFFNSSSVMGFSSKDGSLLCKKCLKLINKCGILNPHLCPISPKNIGPCFHKNSGSSYHCHVWLKIMVVLFFRFLFNWFK